MWHKYLSLAAVVALVAACETPPAKDGSTTGAGEYGADSGSDMMGGRDAYGDGMNVPDAFSQIADRVYFATDSSVLDAEAQQTLRMQAAWLMKHPSANMVVEGHCDERGTREYNLALGERRANAAKRFLIQLGVGADRLSTISYGKERPAVAGHTSDVWSKNRRAVSIIQ